MRIAVEFGALEAAQRPAPCAVVPRPAEADADGGLHAARGIIMATGAGVGAWAAVLAPMVLLFR